MLLFSAVWCGNCKPIKSFIESEKLNVEVVDIDTHRGMEIATQQGVRGIPALVDGNTFITGANEIMKHLKRGG